VKDQDSKIKTQNLVLIIVLALSMCTGVFAEIKTSVDITDVGMGARPIALGGAYTALADDASAIFTNPAGLGLQKDYSFVSMSTQLLTCVDYKLAGFAYPTRYGTFGIGYVGVSSPAGNHIYTSGGITIEGGPIYYSNSMILLSYGCGLNRQLSLGTNLKILAQGFSGDIDGAPSASGTELDLGAMYKLNNSLTFGATLQNIYGMLTDGSINWSTGEKEKLPTLLKLGCSYRALDNVLLNLDSTSAPGTERNLVFNGGAEWQVVEALALRAGFDQKNESVSDGTAGVSTRLALGVGLTWTTFRFDYAFRYDPEFNDLSTHYFSFSIFANPPEKQYDKVIEPIKSVKIQAGKAAIEASKPMEIDTPLAKIEKVAVEKSVLAARSAVIKAPAAKIEKVAAKIEKVDPKVALALKSPDIKAPAAIKVADLKIEKAAARALPSVKSAAINVPSAKIEKVDAKYEKAATVADVINSSAKIERVDAKYEKSGITDGNALSDYEKLIEKEYKSPYDKLVDKNRQAKAAQKALE
jgi:hypothetical protein